jgi:nucleotide-binding universal stress UspA family protein
MFTTIVVGTDGSDSAALAVREAADIARAGGGTLHVVHAFQPVDMGKLAMAAGTGGASVDFDSLNSGIEDHARRLCTDAGDAARVGDVACETHVVPGDPCEALIAVAEEVQADLIVVGNRGMTGLKRFVLGSVPNKIAHHAPCSVLIAHTTG